ncbi:MAG: DNA repair protein RecO [Sarcina ventriculi]|uniref:DNA repair protein RecO n=1 Tax=Sarcina ventriculi TaxID=1267 RepID=UPI0009EACD34|nr:DNA repair protein RecO [Sarcina ventriculi]MBU5321467.1 DNA repair protein RecO [Sarcina ventriculi]MDD7373488.1 DNA repair protein RecO [Sarcina ventriculi]MDO4401712.1 DNA repair protein RecO [Clostridiaceae bacterium]MDY7062808.1 DNA repair protein RecO [Sarcina ventriculi]
MSLTKVNGVVIKTQEYKENDKLLWIFTQELGKISVIAKGAKKSKNKLFSVTTPFCYGDYLVFKGKNLYSLSEGKIRKSFQSFLDNLEKLTYASYICELIDICIEDNEKNSYLYKECITCLYLLNTDAIDYETLIRAFELKILKATGYGLNLDNCVSCKEKIQNSNYLDLAYFGGVCEKCRRERGIYIDKATFASLKFLNNTTLDKVYKLHLSDDTKSEIYKITHYIISSVYSRKPKSLEMLNFIKE